MVMRRIAAAAALAAFLAMGSRPAAADDLDLGDLDKQAHLAVSYGLSLTGQVVLRRHDVPRWQAAAIAAAATLALGTAKELVDDPFSWADMGANAIGVGLSVGIVFAFEL
jgi:hypothetical protein